MPKSLFFGFLGFTTLVQFVIKSIIRFTFAKCSNLSPSINAKKWKFCSKGFVNQYCFVGSGLKIVIKYYFGFPKKNIQTMND